MKSSTFKVLTFFWVIVIAGCNNSLTRDRAQNLLNENRGTACQATLSFVDGGLKRAASDGVIKKLPEENYGLLGSKYYIADVSGEQDRWLVISDFDGQRIQRERNPRRCISGTVEVTAIVDGPIESIKMVEFTEKVLLPSELIPIRSYIYTAYRKQTAFQRTDQGWRIAR